MSLYGSEIAYKKKKTLQHVLTAIIQGPKGPLDRDYPFQHLGQCKLGLAVLLASFKLQSFGWAKVGYTLPK